MSTGATEPPSLASLAPAWQVWIAENLLRGVSGCELVAALEPHGVPEAVTRAAIAELAAHPAYQAGDRQAQLVRRMRFLANVERTLARAAPPGIPRLAGVSPERFYADFYALNRPVVLTDLTDAWRARTLWSPAHFRERYGTVPVKITTGREADPDFLRRLADHVTETTMADYVGMVEAAGSTNDFYMIAINRNLEAEGLAGLLEDVRPLPPMLAPTLAPATYYFWFGPAGTLTPLHHDQANILFCQVLGRKRFHLVSPRELAPLEHSKGFVCDFDCERPDFDAFPGFREVTIHEVVLEPGDALFIPVGWWHQVRALELGVSVTFTGFTAPNDFAGAFDTLVSAPLTF